MIRRVRGTLLRRELSEVEVMTTGGVAYEIEIPLAVYEALPRAGEEVELRTYQVVREDDITLYGFNDERGRALFARLLTASGVGPRLALTMLSTLSPRRLARAITDRDTAVLTQVPGIGKKTAERIGLELSDKLDEFVLAPAEAGAEADADEAVSALVALGYSAAKAGSAVRKALDEDEGREGVALIKAALEEV